MRFSLSNQLEFWYGRSTRQSPQHSLFNSKFWIKIKLILRAQQGMLSLSRNSVNMDGEHVNAH